MKKYPPINNSEIAQIFKKSGKSICLDTQNVASPTTNEIKAILYKSFTCDMKPYPNNLRFTQELIIHQISPEAGKDQVTPNTPYWIPIISRKAPISFLIN